MRLGPKSIALATYYVALLLVAAGVLCAGQASTPPVPMGAGRGPLAGRFQWPRRPSSLVTRAPRGAGLRTGGGLRMGTAGGTGEHGSILAAPGKSGRGRGPGSVPDRDPGNLVIS